MPRAIILGGNGTVGLAATRRLLGAQWSVEICGRGTRPLENHISESGATFSKVDRNDPAELNAILREGADLLLDCVCYTSEQAEMLLPFLDNISSTVMISSKAVYIDSQGRHSNSDERPVFEGPIREDQPTMSPSDIDFDSREGYGANKVAAEHVLLESGFPVSVLRPSKIHGAQAFRHPREWVFARRILDGRRNVLLSNRGEGTDHTTASSNLAALIEIVANKPGQRILNSADPDAPSGLDISRVVSQRFDYRWEEILLEPDVDPTLGNHPWNSVPPIVLDTSASTNLGYTPVGDYASTVIEELDWLMSVLEQTEGGWTFRGVDLEFFEQYFDYESEDRYLSSRTS